VGKDADEVVEHFAVATHAPVARFCLHRHADRDGREPRAGLRGPRLVAALTMGDEEDLLNRVLDFTRLEAEAK